MVQFNESKKGQNASKRFEDLMNKGWDIVSALDLLVAYGYAGHFVTDVYGF